MNFKQYLEYIRFKNNSDKVITVNKYINLSNIIVDDIEGVKGNYIYSKDVIRLLEDYRIKIIEKL